MLNTIATGSCEAPIPRSHGGFEATELHTHEHGLSLLYSTASTVDILISCQTVANTCCCSNSIPRDVVCGIYILQLLVMEIVHHCQVHRFNAGYICLECSAINSGASLAAKRKK